MIRLLTAGDNEQVMHLLTPEAAFNIFLVGDIENFGYHTDFHNLWGDFDANGSLRGILLRFYKSVTVYAPGEYDVAGFTDILAGLSWEGIAGKRQVIEQLWPAIAEMANQRVMHFAEMKRLLPYVDRTLPAGYVLHKAGPENVDEMVDLSQACFGSSFGDAARESLRRELHQGVATIWCISHSGKIISKAQSTAENSLSAMIVAVCTDKEYRGQGLATVCMRALCRDHLERGRSLCLFWDDPIAGQIYAKLGFTDIGEWTMVKRRR